MDTPPLCVFVLMPLVLLTPRGAGALNTGLAEEAEEDDEQGGEDCGGGWGSGRGRLE